MSFCRQLMYSIIRPLLFKFDAEYAHNLVLGQLARAEKFGLLPRVNPNVQPTRLMGLDLPNPVGLAAGLDKNGACIDGLATLGFGFIEIGTLTPRPQVGNPKPRLFRLAQHQAILNRMGFNNQGIDVAIANIERAKFRGVLGINIGKNATTPIEQSVDDYLVCLEKAYPYASYITVNISSPNTKNLRSLQESDELLRLLGSLKDKQQSLQSVHAKYVPLAVKIAPDLGDEQVESVAAVVQQTEIDAVIATNTTIDKTTIMDSVFAQEQGGLSGQPVFRQSNHVLQLLAQELKGRVPVIGVGGIMSGQDALTKIQLGAEAIQIYSGLIFKGPRLVRDCLQYLKSSGACAE